MSLPTHRPGCSEQRNTKCLCEYLSQWDSKPALPDAQFFTAPGTPAWSEEIPNTDNPGFESGLTARYGLPVVIVSGDADPAEVAEKIVRDNPHWFGELPPETYISSKPTATVMAEMKRVTLERNNWRDERNWYQRAFWFMGACAAAGWAYGIARGIWGF